MAKRVTEPPNNPFRACEVCRVRRAAYFVNGLYADTCRRCIRSLAANMARAVREIEADRKKGKGKR